MRGSHQNVLYQKKQKIKLSERQKAHRQKPENIILTRIIKGEIRFFETKLEFIQGLKEHVQGQEEKKEVSIDFVYDYWVESRKNLSPESSYTKIIKDEFIKKLQSLPSVSYFEDPQESFVQRQELFAMIDEWKNALENSIEEKKSRL